VIVRCKFKHLPNPSSERKNNVVSASESEKNYGTEPGV